MLLRRFPIKRMIGSGADAGHHLANLITFPLAAVILLAWQIAYLVGWLRGIVQGSIL